MKLHFLYGHELEKLPSLKDSMFRDRGDQFVERLKWSALSKCRLGWERDQYDVGRTVYIIWEKEPGKHGASMRLLPMQNRTMISDHFAELVPCEYFRQDGAYECSRFVTARGSSRLGASAMFAAAGQIFQSDAAKSFVGLFDQRMLRVYRMMKNYPMLLGSQVFNGELVSAGQWKMSESVWKRSMSAVGLSELEIKKMYLESSFSQKDVQKTDTALVA